MDILVLGVVNDVMSVTKCSNTAVTNTATINAFMELNRLKLATKKCAQIHIEKKHNKFPVARVHNEKMQSAKTRKYLGDIISEVGTYDETVRARTLKGYSYLYIWNQSFPIRFGIWKHKSWS